jgi:hypothetical protein
VGIFLLVSAFGVTFGGVGFAISPERWKTLRKMAVTFAAALGVAVAVGLLIPMATGMLVGGLHSPPQRPGLIAQFSTSVALLFAGAVGWLHVRELKQLARFREDRSKEKA